MLRGLFADSPPFNKLVMLFFIMMACFLMFAFIGILLAPLMFGVPIEEIINGYDTDNSLNIMRYRAILNSVSMFLIPAFVAAYLFLRTNEDDYFGFRRNASLMWFGASLLLILFVSPFINFLIFLNDMIVFPKSLAGLEQWFKNYEESAQQSISFLINVDNTSGLIFNIFMLAVLPAIGEELIFRGLLHNIFVKWTGNIHVAIIVTGFIFSAMHMQFYGLFPRWLLGVMFGYLLVWSGTIWLPIFAHFVNNTAVVLVYSLIHKGTISEKFEIYGTNWTNIPVTILATSVCAILLWVMYRKSKEPTKKQLAQLLYV